LDTFGKLLLMECSTFHPSSSSLSYAFVNTVIRTLQLSGWQQLKYAHVGECVILCFLMDPVRRVLM